MASLCIARLERVLVIDWAIDNLWEGGFMNINEFPSSNGMGGQKDKPISTEATKYLSQDHRERKSTNFPNVKDEKEN